MTSFPTVPSFAVASAGWSEELLAHPAMRFMQSHDADMGSPGAAAHRAKPYFATPSFRYTKSTGQSMTGAEAVEAGYAEMVMFAAHKHEPVICVLTELEDGRDGYRLFAHAKMYVDLQGAPEGAEKKAIDADGRAWELSLGGAFLCDIIKDDSGVLGFRFASVQVFFDPTPALGIAIKRGLVPVEMLL